MSRQIVKILAIALIQLICIAQFECAFAGQAEQAPELISSQAGITAAAISFAFFVKSENIFKQTLSYKNAIALSTDSAKCLKSCGENHAFIVQSFERLLNLNDFEYALLSAQSSAYCQSIISGISTRAPPALMNIEKIMPNCCFTAVRFFVAQSNQQGKIELQDYRHT